MDGILIKTLVQGFQGAGGVFMWTILLTGMVGLAITCERVYYLVFKCGTGRGKFMSDLLKIIKTGDYQKALRFSSGSESPLAKLIVVILQSKDKGEKSLNKRVDEVFLTETPRIQRYTPLLVVVANISTLVGLLGTIFGLIMAFDAVANVPAAQRATALAMGITVAMATTAFGLAIAIPCLIANGVLVTQTERIVEEMDEKSAKMINILTEE